MVERRSSPRLAVEIPSPVELDGETHAGVLRDVSAVGARVETTDRLAENARAHLVLRVAEASDVPELTVSGRVMYSRERDGRIHTGIQFIELDAERHRAVHAFLTAIVDRDGGGDRAHPRVHHRHELVAQSKTEVRAYLNDISAGGLSITMEEPVTVGDEITTSFKVGSLRALVLPGEVVRVEQNDDGSHRIGIELGELDDETNALLKKLIKALLSPAKK